jgi:thymidine kinase
MAKLYFYYASMNAGKSTILLQTAFNYRERGMRAMLYTAGIHDRSGFGVIDSRIGIKEQANTFNLDTNLRAEVQAEIVGPGADCVLIDEAQFLTGEQVLQLASVCDELRVPVLAYGLRTDFQGNLFPGSAGLLALADKLVELKAICECGRKATMNLRVDGDGKAVRAGQQTEIGGNDRYLALCRRHFMEQMHADDAPQLRLMLPGTLEGRR